MPTKPMITKKSKIQSTQTFHFHIEHLYNHNLDTEVENWREPYSSYRRWMARSRSAGIRRRSNAFPDRGIPEFPSRINEMNTTATRKRGEMAELWTRQNLRIWFPRIQRKTPNPRNHESTLVFPKKSRFGVAAQIFLEEEMFWGSTFYSGRHGSSRIGLRFKP